MPVSYCSRAGEKGTPRVEPEGAVPQRRVPPSLAWAGRYPPANGGRTLAGYSAHMAEHVTAEELARLQGVTSVDDPNAIAPQADPFGSDDECAAFLAYLYASRHRDR